MKRRALLTAVVIASISADGFCAGRPVEIRADWAVIVGQGPPAESASVETVLHSLADVLRREYEYQPDRVVEIVGDINPRTFSSLFERIGGEKADQISVLLYIAAEVSLERHGKDDEIYILPPGVPRDATWRLIPLSPALRMLRPGASVVIITSSCVADLAYSKSFAYQFLTSDMPAVSFMTVCPPDQNPVEITSKLGAVLSEVTGETLMSRELYERLQAKLPARRVTLLADQRSSVDFSIRRKVDRVRALVSSLRSATTADQKMGAIDDLARFALLPTGSASARTTAGQEILNLARSTVEPIPVRYAAISVLGQLAFGGAESDLLRILSASQEDATLRVAAVDALDKLPVTARVRYIEIALKDSDPRVRVAAIRSVKLVKDDRIGPRLAARIRSDPSDDVRIAALQAVADFPPSAQIRTAVEQAFEHGESGAVRSEAVLTWGRLGESMAHPTIARMLREDPDTSVRQTIALALGRFFDQGNGQALEDMLELASGSSMPVEVRRAAMASWRRIDDDRSAQALIRGLQDADEGVKLAAIAGVADRKINAAVPALSYLSQQTSIPLKRSAIAALGGIGDSNGTRALYAALKDEDAGVRDEALKALRKISAPATEGELLEQLSDDYPAVRAVAITHVSSENVTPAVKDRLVELLGDSDTFVSEVAVSTVAKFRDPYTVDRVIGLLEKGDWFQRVGAARALGEMGDSQARPALRRRATDPNAFVRAEAVRALGRFDDRATDTAVFFRAAEDRDATVRMAAVEPLRMIGSAQALETLKRLSKDEVASVRSSAADALSRAQ